MQSVFFLSLFSLVFFMFSGLTTGLGKNVMELNEERVKDVKLLFGEIEIALNKIVFGIKDVSNKGIVDMTNNDIASLSGSFLPSHVGFAKRQIETDPWGNKNYLLKNTEQIAIWGGPNGQVVKAPITTFLLISAGPNEEYDFLKNLGANVANPNLTASQIKTSDISDVSKIGDDIIRRFNNYEPMLNIWQRAENLDLTIKSVALDYYKGLVDAFSPLIQLSQRDINRGGALKENVFEDLGGSGYGAFDLLSGEDTSILVNEWSKDDTSNPNDTYDVLIGNFRVAKYYNDEFVLSADGAENSDLNTSFKTKYNTNSKKFLYPTFDVLIRDSSGNDLPATEKGLKNLGIANLSSVDPFYDIDGEVTYSYNPDAPSKFSIKREKLTTDTDKWYIKKELEIDALGGL